MAQCITAMGASPLGGLTRSASLPNLNVQGPPSPEEQKLQCLPQEITDNIMELALVTGREAAFEYLKKEGRLSSAKLLKRSLKTSLISSLKGLMLQDANRDILCDEMVLRFMSVAGYYVATQLEKEKKERQKNKKTKAFPPANRFELHMQKELSRKLIDIIDLMAQHCISHEIRLRDRRSNESVVQADLDYVKFLCKKISCDVKLIKIDFLVDEGTVIDKETGHKRQIFDKIKKQCLKPKDVKMEEEKLFEEELCNETDTEQTMEFGLTEIQGKTKCTAANVGFRFGVNASFTAGFPGACELNVGAAFQVSRGYSTATTLFSETTKTHSFECFA